MDHDYEVLGLRSGATLEEIRGAYRELAKLWHPDRHSGDPGLQKRAQARMAEINEAYRKLRASQRNTAARGPGRPQPARRREERDGNHAWLVFSRETSLISPAVFEVEVPPESCLMKNHRGRLAKDAPAGSETWAIRVRPGEITVTVRSSASLAAGLPGEKRFPILVGRSDYLRWVLKSKVFRPIVLERMG